MLIDETGVDQFIAIDRWASQEVFNKFNEAFRTEYEKLDTECEGPTEQEKLIGRYISAA